MIDKDMQYKHLKLLTYYKNRTVKNLFIKNKNMYTNNKPTNLSENYNEIYKYTYGPRLPVM